MPIYGVEPLPVISQHIDPVAALDAATAWLIEFGLESAEKALIVGGASFVAGYKLLPPTIPLPVRLVTGGVLGLVIQHNLFGQDLGQGEETAINAAGQTEAALIALAALSSPLGLIAVLPMWTADP